MEIQLQELIEQIKKDGVAVAETEAASIVDAAKAEAAKILADAKAEASATLQKAKEENNRLVQVSEDAIRQAGRNMLLSFRESVAKELEAVVGKQVTATYSSEAIVELIAKVVEAWAKNSDEENVAVLLNSQDLAKLEESLLAALKAHALTGVTLQANDSFDGGFRVAVNEGRAYYDYSAQAVTDMLSAYLTPRVTALMKEAEGL